MSRGSNLRSALRKVGLVGWVLPAVLFVVAFLYLPLFQNFRMSMIDWDIYKQTEEFIGLDNYRKLLHDRIVRRALLNNTAYAVVSVTFQVFGALTLAAMIESVRSERWRQAFRAIYFIPSAVSLTVAGLLFYFIYEPRIGLLNALLELVGLGAFAQPWLGQESTAMWGIIAMSQWQGFGYSVLLFAVAIQRIPREMYEAAALEGVGPISRFRYVTVPLVREMTALVVIVTITGAFQVFNEVVVMTTGGPNNSTQVLGTWLYRSAFVRNDFGYAASIAMVVFGIALGAAAIQLYISHRRRVEW